MKKNKLFLSAFITGFSLMVMELIASRLIAPIVGTSLYTWTSIIGVVLLGSSLGNFFGGKYIDKHYTSNIISFYFILAGLYIYSIPFLLELIKGLATFEISLLFIVLIICSLLFFIPSAIIGCIYPSLYKFAATNHQTSGNDLGILAAIWSIGSIGGTFLTGFVFVTWLGTSLTLYLVASILILTSLLFFKGKFINYVTVLILISLLIHLNFYFADRNEGDVLNTESAYYKIRIVDSRKPPYEDMRLLLLDIDFNGITPLNGQILETYPYMYPAFNNLNKNISKVLVIGGGSESIAKNIYSHNSNADISTVEIDPMLVEISKQYFKTNSIPVSSIASDGRVYLNKTDQKYDLIFSDAYNSFISIPWHMSTLEFNNLVKSRLNQKGIYAINFISTRSGDDSDLFESMVATFEKTFPNYYIFAFNSKLTDIQNVVLVGINSFEHIKESELRKQITLGGNPILAQRIIDRETILLDEAKTIILTDNFAPTDRLMAPLIKRFYPKHIVQYLSLN